MVCLQADDVAALAAHMGVDETGLREEILVYNAAMAGQHPDPHGKTAFPSGGLRVVWATALMPKPVFMALL